ncbi:hypothetical protein [Streptomyces sp. NPDC002550]
MGGVILGAEFLADTGGDMTGFGTSRPARWLRWRRPVPRDPGTISGNLLRPRRYSRRFQRVFCTSALFSIRRRDDPRRFYDRKRAEGTRRTQGVPALARRRINVLWALLRDGRCYEPKPPAACAESQ